MGGHAWLATPTGCRLVGSGPPSPWSENTAPPPSWCDSDSWMDDSNMYQYKIIEMMDYFLSCSCFEKGMHHSTFEEKNMGLIHNWLTDELINNWWRQNVKLNLYTTIGFSRYLEFWEHFNCHISKNGILAHITIIYYDYDYNVFEIKYISEC